ncbi:MAG: DeoR/GlpR transcriptional regulator, partial [Epulopiscium sp.]|nr:DeoR/GlpR transcriptional regulator [Candidatus Epulonipiscium sp.]
MLALERRNAILALIQEKESVKVQYLSKQFDVTEETIRRDLEKLELEGYVKRTYGGAVLKESTSIDPPFTIREGTNIKGKEAIAKKVMEYIKDGDTLMLDSSSTALHVARELREKQNITVITNSTKIVLELANAPNCTVISTGGMLKSSSLSFVGYRAEEFIQNYNVNKAILSCKGLRMDKGLMETNEMEAQVKQAMVKSADKVFLIVDYTKFDKTSFVNMLAYDQIDLLFTDESLSMEWEQFLQEVNIKYIYP